MTAPPPAQPPAVRTCGPAPLVPDVHTHHPCVGADIRITVSLSERERGERDREAATDTRRG